MNMRLLPVENSEAWFALDVACKATLLLLLATLLVLLSARTSAALRHRIWTMSFVGLLLLALLSVVAPGREWHIIPHHWQPVSVVAEPPVTTSIRLSRLDTAPAIDAPDQAATAPAATMNPPTPDQEPVRTIVDGAQRTTDDFGLVRQPVTTQVSNAAASRPTRWLLLTWLSGACLALVPLIVGLLINLQMRLRCEPVADADWQHLLVRLSGRLGLRRRVTLFWSGPKQMPMTFGFWRPCVVLPADAPDWSAERKQIVLLHELSHIKRYDVPLQMIARLACAVYWFHPLAWWALRRMRIEREHACDDAVLLAGQKASDYASQLLEIARVHAGYSPLYSAALSMARRSQLEGRLLAVLDAHRCRTPLSRSWTGGLTTLTLALAMGLGIVRPALEAKTPEPVASASVAASPERGGNSKSQMVLTGIVLSPKGKPVAGASVEVIATNPRYDRPSYVAPENADVERYQTKTDDGGRFQFVLSRNISRPRQSLIVYAGADGYALAIKGVDTRRSRNHVEMKLHDTKAVRLQLVDTAGMPVSGVEPFLQYAMLGKGEEGWGAVGHGSVNISRWPRCSPSDKDGFVSLAVPASAEELHLKIDDARFGAHLLNLKVSDRPIVVALKSPRILKGTVKDVDNGQPIAGAEVVMIFENPPRRVRTGPDGSYRIVSGGTVESFRRGGASTIQVYPPPESDYLFYATEWKRPDDGFSSAELTIALQHGVVVEGQVVERGTGLPVAGASIQFESQQRHNPYFRENGRARLVGSDMKYVTDPQGKFRMPVRPGPGYLLVAAPTLDYLHSEISTGEMKYGKAGMEREYYDGVLRVDLKPDDHPKPFSIELERGVTLRCKVVRPDGHPANGKGFARSYLQHKHDAQNWLPDFVIEDGVLELPGFESMHTNPLFLFDQEHHCGATVSPADVSADGAGPTIQLRPCGSAKFRFVNEKGKPLAGYRPMPFIVVTPGAAFTGRGEPNQPLWVDSVIWQNIAWQWPAQPPKADADGRLTINDLIPGATYRLSFPGKTGMWDDGYEFTVRAGQTTDVGQVVLPQPE